VDEVLAEKKKRVENLNRIAELIQDVGFSYDRYDDTVRTLNYHYALLHDTNVNAPPFIELENCNFESFEEKYLKGLIEFWSNKVEELQKKHSRLYFNVDSDDYK
jgi:hypothetical protein